MSDDGGNGPSQAEDSENNSGKDIKYTLHNGIFKEFCEKAKESPNKKFVFIIDEINRGNISKIFGELITLIEDTKRKGKPEAMSAKLPYSGKEFSVPENVYIIGTMNTADRSIAMIDTALRRRFRFVEMMPDPGLLDDKATNLLKKINERIEYLYDREHTIGHSFFMPLKDITDSNSDEYKNKLCEIFVYNIIPLLQEYFYEDYKKIALVLGCSNKDGFVKKKDNELSTIFGGDSDTSDLDSENIYELNSEIKNQNGELNIENIINYINLIKPVFGEPDSGEPDSGDDTT